MMRHLAWIMSIKVSAAWVVVSFLIGSVVIPLLGISQDTKSFTLERESKIISYMEKKHEIYRDIDAIAEEYSILVGTDGTYSNPQALDRIDKLAWELDLLKDYYDKVELQLSALDDRQPEPTPSFVIRKIGAPGATSAPQVIHVVP